MSNRDNVLAFLRSISPADASNEEIVGRTGIKPHQQVFMITRELLRTGIIKGRQAGKEWRFWSAEHSSPEFTGTTMRSPTATAPALSVVSPTGFEKLAQRAMSDHYGTALAPASVAGVPKIFDLVSDDHRIVGDAKFYTLVQGERLPPAKFSIVAEHVWLLEKTNCERRFLVFGNDRRVPERWLQRYGALASAVEFYFLDGDGKLHALPQ